MSGNLCGAKTRSGGTCKRYRVPFATRCRLHGGASPKSLQKAAERRVEQQAKAVLADLAEPISPGLNAVGELERLGSEVVMFKDLLLAMVGDLQEVRYQSAQSFE